MRKPLLAMFLALGVFVSPAQTAAQEYYVSCTLAVDSGLRIFVPFRAKLRITIPNARGGGSNGTAEARWIAPHELTGLDDTLPWVGRFTSARHEIVSHFPEMGQWYFDGPAANSFRAECYQKDITSRLFFIRPFEYLGNLRKEREECDQDDEDVLWIVADETAPAAEPGPALVDCGGSIPDGGCEIEWICVDMWTEATGWVEVWCEYLLVCYN